jgi:hypothetical protein
VYLWIIFSIWLQHRRRQHTRNGNCNIENACNKLTITDSSGVRKTCSNLSPSCIWDVNWGQVIVIT